VSWRKKNAEKIFFVAVAIVMFVSSSLTFNIRSASCATVFSQDFDGETTGSIPQGWTVANPSVCSLTINDTVYHGSSGKSARFADMASYTWGFAYVGTNFEDQQGYLTISFAIMAENPDYFMLYIGSTDRTSNGPNIYFVPDSRYLAYCDEFGLRYLCPFSVGTWYNIKMTIDIPSNTYDIYVDDAIKAQGAHFRYFGQTTHLNSINFGGDSWEMPIGFIDDISIFKEERKSPIATVTALTGSLDYLLQEDVRIRLDALVKDTKTMAPISNASVIVQIYYPNGSLWTSVTMIEELADTGVYEWQSNETIHQMNLENGVYLARVEAAVGDESPSTDILLFHIDPPATPEPTSTLPESYYITLAMTLVAATALGAILLGRNRKRLSKTGKIRINANP
jgi:hypothetical protein